MELPGHRLWVIEIFEMQSRILKYFSMQLHHKRQLEVVVGPVSVWMGSIKAGLIQKTPNPNLTHPIYFTKIPIHPIYSFCDC